MSDLSFDIIERILKSGFPRVSARHRPLCRQICNAVDQRWITIIVHDRTRQHEDTDVSALVAKCPNLEEVWFPFGSLVRPSVTLPSLSGIRRLRIDGIPFEAVNSQRCMDTFDMAWFKDLHSLEFLSLTMRRQHGNVDVEHRIVNVHDLPTSLTEIMFDLVVRPRDSMVSCVDALNISPLTPISRLTSLRALTVRNDATRYPMDWGVVLQALTSLSRISMLRCDIAPSLLVPLSGRLVDLELVRNRRGVDVDALASLTALTKLNLQNTSLSGDVDKLTSLSSLAHLDMWEGNYSGRSIECFGRHIHVETLAAMTALTYLDVRGIIVCSLPGAVPFYERFQDPMLDVSLPRLAILGIDIEYMGDWSTLRKRLKERGIVQI